MSKAFVRETQSDEEERPEAAVPEPGGRNYVTPAGFARMKAELRRLVELERPEVVRTVSWAAANGDRSENGDYLYGKRRLREIDRRTRDLVRRLESSQVVDNAGRDTDQIFFGARVRVSSATHGERSLVIVGADEVDPAGGLVSWRSPIAQALLKAREGDRVVLRSPGGEERLDILEVTYEEPAT